MTVGSTLRATSHKNCFLAAVDSAKFGDPTAIDDVISESLPHITSYLKRRGSVDPEALANVVALEFINNLRKLDFASDGQAWSYIYRICRSRLVDEHRRSNAQRRQCELVDRDQPTRVFDQDVVDRLWVDDALQALTDEQRKIVELRFLNDFSIAETAERTGKSATAVKGLQRRALRQLAGVVLMTMASLAVVAAIFTSSPAAELPQIQTGGQPAIATNGSADNEQNGGPNEGQGLSSDGTVSSNENGTASPGLSIYGDGEFIDQPTPMPTDPTTETVDEATSSPTTILATETPIDPTATTTSSAAAGAATAGEPSQSTTALPQVVSPTTAPPSTDNPPTTIAGTTSTTVVLPGETAPTPTAVTGSENLVPNGSFEILNDPVPAFTLLRVPSWSTSAESGEIEVWRSGHSDVRAFAGQHFVELNGLSADTIWTTVPVTAGKQYNFSFRHRGRLDNDSVQVLVGDRVLLQVSSGPEAWNQGTVTVTAPEKTKTLTIALRAVDPGTQGNFIDDIRLTEVP